MYTRVIAALAAFCISMSSAKAAAPLVTPDSSAKLTEAHGVIFKRDFVDWTKELWRDPEPATVGDILKEGMQLGTGSKSWAQVSWPNVATRAWSNTIFAIAPNQKLVYLLGGEMLFQLDKHRKEKKDYVIWTKVLQARIRGTTVLVQSTPEVSRITVLEGCVEVMNRLDHSLVRINPGVVYQVRINSTAAPEVKQSEEQNDPGEPAASKELSESKSRNAWRAISRRPGTFQYFSKRDNNLFDRGSLLGHPAAGKTAMSQNGLPGLPELPPLVNKLGKQLSSNLLSPLLAGTGEKVTAVGSIIDGTTTDLASELTAITTQARPILDMFETKKTITSLVIVDTNKLREHPLLQDFHQPISSQSLIDSSFEKLPAVCHQVIPSGERISAADTPSGLPDLKGEDKVLVESTEILRVPTTTSYRIGQLVGRDMPVPPHSISLFTPVGVIGQTNNAPAGTNPSALPILGASDTDDRKRYSQQPGIKHGLFGNNRLNQQAIFESSTLSKSANLRPVSNVFNGGVPQTGFQAPILIPTGVTGNLVGGIGGSQQVSGSLPVNLPGNLPASLPANLPVNLPGNLPANLPAVLPGGLPGNLPTNLPVNQPGGNSGGGGGLNLPLPQMHIGL